MSNDEFERPRSPSSATMKALGPTGFCKLCGKEFLIPGSAENKKFCGAECRVEWWKQKRQRVSRMILEEERNKG